MPEFIVHTVRGEQGIHFIYRVQALKKDLAFPKLQLIGAIDRDETHVETFRIPEENRSYELIAIFKERGEDRAPLPFNSSFS